MPGVHIPGLFLCLGSIYQGFFLCLESIYQGFFYAFSRKNKTISIHFNFSSFFIQIMFDFLSQIQDAIVISIAPHSFKLEENGLKDF